ncbi:PLP-dependent transferase [Meredithblackwellia eburnea MCA 4105]
MDREQFRKAGYAAIDRVADYFDSLPSQDVQSSVAPGFLPPLIGDAPPTQGEAWEEIEKDVDRVIMPGITHWQSPNFFAFFPANSTYESIIADIYVGAMSNPGFNWACSPSCTELEVVMMDWVAKLFSLDPSFYNSSNVGGGIIMGSASESCFTAVIAARERALRLAPDTKHENLVLYGTTQTHSLGAKAALILGLKFKAIETRAEDMWGLRGSDLKETLDEDIANGLVPFCLIATLGSTSTGAVDNIPEITSVLSDYPLVFLHVDAAWAGVFLACPENHKVSHLEAINARSKAVAETTALCASGEVHSFCTNLHKSGLVTFDASCLWVRDRKLLTEALDITPPFLRNKHSDQGTVVDYRNWQTSLGRRFRSLKIMFVLRSYGVSGFQAHLRQLVSLASHFESLVASERDAFELFVPRSFALVVFRLRGTTEEEADALNRHFFALTTERKDITLTPTVVGGKYCTRVAVGSPLTKVEHIDAAWSLVQQLAQEARKTLKVV